MSGMADEMAARMAADGLDPTPAADPGTGGNDPQPSAAPPAGALNTDTAAGGQEPGPVPYSRFREVNEAYQNLRGYETLMQYGYDPDSLGRLAQFEAAYVQDPHSTVSQLVDNLDLPDEAKTQIREMLTVENGEPPAGEGTPATPATTDEPPAWARPLIEDHESRQRAAVEQRENAFRQQALDEVLGHWNAADEAAGISTSEGIKLSLIASYAASGQFTTPQALAEAARSEYLSDREAAVGSYYVPRDGAGPRSVPRSAAVPSGPMKFKDIKEASKAAAADIEAGRLPPIKIGE